MSNPNLDVPCPTCGAEAGKRCRTMKTGRTTDTHNARWNQQFYIQEWQSRDEPQTPDTVTAEPFAPPSPPEHS